MQRIPKMPIGHDIEHFACMSLNEVETWCNDAFRRIISFLYDTISEYAAQLELDVIKENHIYWSAFRPMGYQNIHFGTYSWLKVDKMRYQRAFLREWDEVTKLAYLLQEKGKMFLR